MPKSSRKGITMTCVIHVVNLEKCVNFIVVHLADVYFPVSAIVNSLILKTLLIKCVVEF